MTKRRLLLATSPGCVYCVQAKAILNAKGVPYKEKQILSNNDWDWLEEQVGQKEVGVPQIFINGKHFGGLGELERATKTTRGWAIKVRGQIIPEHGVFLNTEALKEYARRKRLSGAKGTLVKIHALLIPCKKYKSRYFVLGKIIPLRTSITARVKDAGMVAWTSKGVNVYTGDSKLVLDALAAKLITRDVIGNEAWEQYLRWDKTKSRQFWYRLKVPVRKWKLANWKIRCIKRSCRFNPKTKR